MNVSIVHLYMLNYENCVGTDLKEIVHKPYEKCIKYK